MLKITQREREIIKLLGYKNEKIADILCVEKSTVKTHISRILRKLQSTSRIQALIVALQQGIINLFDIPTNISDLGFWDKDGIYRIDMQEINREES